MFRFAVEPEVYRAFDFTVRGKAVPWSAPFVVTGTTKKGKRFRSCKPNVPLHDWQAKVRAAARDVYGPFEPTTDPIKLEIAYCVHSSDELFSGWIARPQFHWSDASWQWNKCGPIMADMTNLTKGIEDALETVFYVDDTQVRWQEVRSVWGVEPLVHICVSFLR